MKLKSLSAIALVLVIFSSCNKEEVNQATQFNSSGTPVVSGFQVTGLPGDASPEIKEEFSKHVNVYGVDVYGSMNATNESLLKSANMLGEFLDNDEDGIVDNQEVVDQLIASGEYLAVYEYDDCPDEEEEEWDEGDFDDMDDMDDMDDEDMDDMDDEDMDELEFEAPDMDDCDWELDPLFQEVFDFVYMYGICNVYDDELGLNQEADIHDWIDEAVTAGYYDEEETQDEVMDEMGYGMLYCDFLWESYLCYMDLTGCVDDEGWDEGDDGFGLTTPGDIEENLPALNTILGNQSYGFPNRLPDGIYHP